MSDKALLPDPLEKGMVLRTKSGKCGVAAKRTHNTDAHGEPRWRLYWPDDKVLGDGEWTRDEMAEMGMTHTDGEVFDLRITLGEGDARI